MRVKISDFDWILNATTYSNRMNIQVELKWDTDKFNMAKMLWKIDDEECIHVFSNIIYYVRKYMDIYLACLHAEYYSTHSA